MRDCLNTFVLVICLFFTALAAYGQSGAARPTPTPEPPEDQVDKVFTEEIRLNISAFDNTGKFAKDVKKEDLVITEDGRIHQADSLRRVPASVLIIIDTGGEERRIKGLTATRQVAKSMVSALNADDSVALMEFNDKANILSEWTSDKTQLLEILTKKLGFGHRARLVLALETAVKFMERAPLENRHIILITDGVDSTATPQEKAAAIKNVLSTNINVHVLSYTLMERNDLPVNKGGIFQKGEPNPKRMPEEVIITMPGPVQDAMRLPRLGSINMDRAMIRKQKERSAALKKSEAELTELSDSTNGEMFLPETTEEMQEKTGVLAKNIDSQYTLTYTPKRPLNEVEQEETRTIEVTSRRPGLVIQGRRKLVVKKQ
ncbi:MAG TPA: VWA domain-containing protein [Pyrinomonadaceae bacterium]|jgi:VWFA-related protein|nr:VWA domain-containing protein [Pyrinomonadaceae bacterium]